MLQDKDTFMGIGSADARVARLDAKEDELRQMELASCNGTVKAAVDAEYNRNRRVSSRSGTSATPWSTKNELKTDRFED